MLYSTEGRGRKAVSSQTGEATTICPVGQAGRKLLMERFHRQSPTRLGDLKITILFRVPQPVGANGARVIFECCNQ
jgi:hypothetical protein